ncbi:beta-ketoacyl-ACP synthase [Blastochloris viridis]|uniref:3-oxoacyl-[acyl-carrier-protein] synthase n=1 Tax=Blastochloris viridis TaxID=1079 RepID=A0A0H5B6S1_BLAVI|nr:beta-ketoacyl-ACP synthase [Blastochloris viridis]ALK08843.1 3-oxoacyl-[acyl-carrier-protein] synthase 2 [Blastochloris viridis]BAR97857.1 3-oxoacyl-[acyl-carrier-protein] synthase [Blastochloris viridis]CUU41504.1 3-oxoacyl-[acyl-carrier-protein] synthase 2 [Blastochloris viridis]
MAGERRDRQGRPVVAITGMGVVTSLGVGKADNWAAIMAGKSGLSTIKRFPLDGLKSTVAGTIDFIPADPFCAAELTERLAHVAVEEAIADAAIGSKGVFPGPLFLAMPPVEIEWDQRQSVLAAGPQTEPVTYANLLAGAATGRFRAWGERFLFGSVADHIAERFGTQGSPITLSTACASGASALQLGVEAIRRGETTAALCVGTDATVNLESLVRFSLLSALSSANEPPQEASKPFSKNRDGFVMAEGAAALVLEDYDVAKARGARILGIVEGVGELADSFHRTRSSPDGKPVIGCMRNALADASVGPEAIDYVNAHGTGTPENDKMEFNSMNVVFGEALKTLPVSSNKSMVGHTLSAAGAIETVFSILTMANGRIPPTINYKVPDPAIPLDVVPNVARDADVARVLSNSFGFGGQNVSLVLAREPA